MAELCCKALYPLNRDPDKEFMDFQFLKLNKQKKQAYLGLIAVAILSFFSFQNFRTLGDMPKENLDLNDMLNSSSHEIQNTKMDLNDDLQAQGGFDSSNLRQIANETKVTEPKGPIKIRLKRAPAKIKAKSKTKKKSSKKPVKAKAKKKKKPIKPDTSSN